MNNLTLVVLSCDKYSDLWDPFVFFFERNWKDCPFPKYIASNHKIANYPGFGSITIGDDVSWSDNLKQILLSVETEYVFFILDDLFLSKKVDNQHIYDCISEFKKLNGNYLKLIPEPKPQNSINKYFGEINKGSLYRSTVVFAIWKKEVLSQLLISGENPWEFEEFSSIRSDQFDGFFVTKQRIISCYHGVVKGKYIYSTIQKIKKEGYDISNLNRSINNRKSEYIFNLRKLRHKLFYFFIPYKLRRKVKNFFTQ